MRLMMAWAHDWRCIPSRLANKIPVASICRGTFLRANIVPPAVTTSPIDRPFDRRGRQGSGSDGDGAVAAVLALQQSRRASPPAHALSTRSAWRG